MKKENSGYQLINEIENKYNVEKLTYYSLPVWLLIRNYVFLILLQGKSDRLNMTLQHKTKAFFSSLRGWWNFLKPSDTWLFGITSDRVLINGKYYDKYVDYPASLFKRSLIIEIPLYKHFHKNEVFSSRIASKGLLILMEKLYMIIFLRKKKIDHEEILVDLLNEYQINIDYLIVAKKMVAQYKVMRLILKINKPKYVFFGTSYTNYGYIKAFREKGIKIFEIQHGVINKEHSGYLIHAAFERTFFPDKLFTFGHYETTIFVDPNNKGIDQKNIIPTGNFYLEHIYRTFIKDNRLMDSIKKYDHVFSVSLQDCNIGEKLLPILLQVSTEHLDCLFILKRRNKLLNNYLNTYNFPKNIIFEEKLDVYQLILHTNLHISVYSSCALEAPALGVKNLLINIENKAQLYYGSILNENTTHFAPDDFGSISNYLKEFKNEKNSSDKIRSYHSNVIISGFKENLKNNMHQYIDKQLLNQ